MQYIKNNYYHIFNRGIDRKSIFLEEENYLHFISLMKKYEQKYNISVIAYCLVPNHYHLLVYQTSDIPVSRFIQSMNNAFVQGMNSQLKRKGTLFEGAAKSRLIENEEYLLQVCRYIHLNPLKHKLVQNLSDWKFSNYQNCINGWNGYLADSGFIEDLFQSKNNYREFVEDYIPAMDEFNELKEYVQEC